MYRKQQAVPSAWSKGLGDWYGESKTEKAVCEQILKGLWITLGSWTSFSRQWEASRHLGGEGEFYMIHILDGTIVVQSAHHVWLFVTPWTAAHQASLSLTVSRSSPKFMSIASVMPSSHLILWCFVLLLPSIFPSIRDFSNGTFRIRWPKYWSFSFSMSPSNKYSGWFPLRLTGLISSLSKGLCGVFSSTTVRRHQVFSAPPSLWSSSHNHTWPLGRQ